MKKGVNLQTLVQKLERTKKASVDFVQKTSNMFMTENGDPSLNFRIGDKYHTAKLTDHAHSQLASWAKIPNRYYQRMRSEQQSLLAANVNTWLHNNKNAARMIRCIDRGYSNDGNVVALRPDDGDLMIRAFLSNRYRRIDNWDIAETTLKALAEIQLKADMKYTVASADLTDSSMYIKIVFDNLIHEVKVGDPVRFGLIVRNSEIGLGRAVVSGFTERLVCTNGMVMHSNYCKTHLGVAIDDQDQALDFYSDQTIKADDLAVQAKLRDAIRGMLSQEHIDEMLYTMRAAVNTEEVQSPKQAVEDLGKKLGMSEVEQDSILFHLARDGDLTKWGMANAVTRTAEDLSSYDRATEFEEFGYTVLKMSNREWSQMAKKAS